MLDLTADPTTLAVFVLLSGLWFRIERRLSRLEASVDSCLRPH